MSTPEPLVLSMPNAPCWKKLLDLEFKKVVDLLNLTKPLPIVSLFNVNITLNTSIIAPDPTKTTPLVPKNPPCIFRVYVALGTSGIFSVQRQSGGTTSTENLNQGVALTANAAYMFDILVDQGEKIDFQSTASGVLLKLSVVEKDDAK